jgi:hypothetical protein
VALHEKSYQTSSLCNLWVLGASVVEQIVRKDNHQDTEDPEIAQRNQTFRAKPIPVPDPRYPRIKP